MPLVHRAVRNALVERLAAENQLVLSLLHQMQSLLELAQLQAQVSVLPTQLYVESCAEAASMMQPREMAEMALEFVTAQV